MNCYIINFEAGSNEDLNGLMLSVKEYRTWARISDTLYAVVTDQSASTIRDNLARYVGEGGRLFVIKSGVEAAWRNARCKNEWLKKHLVRVEGAAS